jgi:hypothetical protein
MKVYNCKVELFDETNIAYCDIRQRLQKHKISVPPLSKSLLKRFDYWVSKEKLKEREDLELLGLCLYDLLLPPDSDVRADFESDYDLVTDSPGSRLRLTLVFHDKAGELASYPWEFLLMPARARTAEKRKRDPFFLAGQR